MPRPSLVTTVVATAYGFITTVTAPNGDVTRVYSSTPVIISDTKPSVQKIRRPDGSYRVVHSAGGQITPTGGARTVATAPTMSAYDELRALGVSGAAASSFRDSDAGPATVEGASPDGTVRPASTPSWAPLCVNKNYDSNHLQLAGCLSQYHIGSSGAVWYMEDKFLASGIMNDSGFDPDEITGLKFGDSYGAGNSIYTWSPSSTSPIGSCRQVTVSAEYKGAGISSTTDECPETFGPVTKNATQFVSKWDGDGNGPSDQGRDTQGVDGVYDGASANPHAGIIYYVWWE